MVEENPVLFCWSSFVRSRCKAEILQRDPCVNIAAHLPHLTTLKKALTTFASAGKCCYLPLSPHILQTTSMLSNTGAKSNLIPSSDEMNPQIQFFAFPHLTDLGAKKTICVFWNMFWSIFHGTYKDFIPFILRHNCLNYYI